MYTSRSTVVDYVSAISIEKCAAAYPSWMLMISLLNKNASRQTASRRDANADAGRVR